MTVETLVPEWAPEWSVLACVLYDDGGVSAEDLGRGHLVAAQRIADGFDPVQALDVGLVDSRTAVRAWIRILQARDWDRVVRQRDDDEKNGGGR